MVIGGKRNWKLIQKPRLPQKQNGININNKQLKQVSQMFYIRQGQIVIDSRYTTKQISFGSIFWSV